MICELVMRQDVDNVIESNRSASTGGSLRGAFEKKPLELASLARRAEELTPKEGGCLGARVG